MTRVQSNTAKAGFLERFARSGNVTAAAEGVNVNRQIVYAWRQRDSKFAEAYLEAERASVDVLDAAAWRRAVQGVDTKRGVYDRNGKLITTETETKYSDNLLMFLLKARDPKKYLPERQQQVELTGKDGEPLPAATVVMHPAFISFQKAVFAVLETHAEAKQELIHLLEMDQDEGT